MFKQVFQIFQTMGRRNQISAFYIILISLLIAFLELLSFTLIVPALSFLLDSNISSDHYIIAAFQNVTSFDIMHYMTLGNILIVLTFVITIKLLLLLYFEYKMSRVMWQTQIDINTKIYRHFTVLSLSEIIDTGFNRIRRLIATDATLFVSQGFNNYILLFKNLTITSVLFFFLLQVDTKATITVFLFISIFIIIFNKLVKNRAIYLSKRFRELTQYKHENINNTLNGIREVKLFNNEEMVTRLFDKNERQLSKFSIERSIFNKVPRLLLEFFVVLGIAIFIFLFDEKGYNFLEILPKITLFGLVFLRILPMATGINGNLIAIKYSKVQIDEIIVYLKKLKTNKTFFEADNFKPFEIKKKIDLELKDVEFAYKNSKNIFKNLNIKFEENKLVGIQGDNGSGKSTLVDLIAGFLKPNSGSIKFNNQDIFKNLKEWRKFIGYVSQTQFLSNDTIKNNIIFSDNQEIDNERLERAITQSGVKDFLYSMSDGINTKVGDLGLKLSGGQKQRITIARVLYRNPKIIIFDEPTSAQDNKIEESFLSTIQKMKSNKMIILISHSKHIHSICDINYRVENNKLIKV
jgi:ABC-type multidrug transport system fused ATPase/permease subunit